MNLIILNGHSRPSYPYHGFIRPYKASFQDYFLVNIQNFGAYQGSEIDPKRQISAIASSTSRKGDFALSPSAILGTP